MSLEAVKALVQRVVADGKFRRSLLQAPDDGLSGYSLDEDERRAILRLRRRLTTVGAGDHPAADPFDPSLPWP